MKMPSVLMLSLVMINFAAEAALPQSVARRFAEAHDSLESGVFRGSYTLTIKSFVAKEDGSKKTTSDVEIAVEVSADGVERRHLVRLITDGKNRTEENRKDIEDQSDEGKDGGDDEDFLLPFANDATRFIFGFTVNAGVHAESTFEPAPGHEDDDGMTTGKMAWDQATLDPLWIEVDVLKPPKPLRELKVRMEFERVGERVYLTRMVTDGRVKVLLMKRNFHMEMTILDLDPQ